MLPDEEPSAEQVAILRRMTPEQRWEKARQIYWGARALKMASIRCQHPEWSEEQLKTEVNRIFLAESMKEC